LRLAAETRQSTSDRHPDRPPDPAAGVGRRWDAVAGRRPRAYHRRPRTRPADPAL